MPRTECASARSGIGLSVRKRKEAVISRKRGRSLCGAGAGPDRGRMAGRHPPRWTIRNRQRWPPRGPARRDGRQWAQRASRGGRGVRGGAGRVLTVSLLIAPAGGSGRRHACQARTPPPWATRCGGEARRTARPTRWAGAVGRAGEKASPPRRGEARLGSSSRNVTTARYCAGPRHSAETPPVGYASPPRQGEAVSLRGLKPSTAGRQRPPGWVTWARRRAGEPSPWPDNFSLVRRWPAAAVLGA